MCGKLWLKRAGPRRGVKTDRYSKRSAETACFQDFIFYRQSALL
jgi:hypothetical protein